MAGTGESLPQRRCWDIVVRLSHWALAGSVLFDLVRDNGDLLHRQVGYVAAAIVLVRLAWAALSSGQGRLAALKPSLAKTLIYLRDLSAGRATHGPGHDPLGLWMVWLLWILVLLLAVTGWMSRLDMFWGDDRILEVHRSIADVLMLAVAVHLGAVLVMSLYWRENLVRGMLNGRQNGG
ncbi:MAG TPA: cytochrome b/b6 domain-containing protein [Burkholderiaceae bacterium]|nr:cytochrome b/b6 domain-containing protein [Burkholderiaceae bacterium]